MIVGKINMDKVNHEYLFKGQKGHYLDYVMMENKDGTDQYGNDGFVKQDIPKEARDRGERGEILGNWKHLKFDSEKKAAPAAKASAPAASQPEDDAGLPF